MTLKSHPFTGECPTAYDGQEIAFEFGAPGGIERIATCEVEVDVGSPLFAAVLSAIESFVSVPTPRRPIAAASPLVAPDPGDRQAGQGATASRMARATQT